MTCDVIIPVFNNSQTLPLVLRALFSQRLPVGWRVGVIISDDGSMDDTLGIARQMCRKSSWGCKVIEGEHVGAAGARNRALGCSKADVIFFLGADIVLKQNALYSHLDWHSQYPENSQAALGIVMWDPRVMPTLLMEWMTHGGSQNNYDAILGRESVDAKHYFYGSHISVKRQVLEDNKFSEKYQRYGWEDIDLGRRLADQCNLKLRVIHGAVGHHRHFSSARQVFKRQRAVGRGFRAFAKDHPKVAIIRADSFLHRLKYAIIQNTGFLFMVDLIIMALETEKSTPYLYRFSIDSHFWCGFHGSFPHKKQAFHTFVHNESTH